MTLREKVEIIQILQQNFNKKKSIFMKNVFYNKKKTFFILIFPPSPGNSRKSDSVAGWENKECSAQDEGALYTPATVS